MLTIPTSKHTPGPWEETVLSDGIFSVVQMVPCKDYPTDSGIVKVRKICLIKPFTQLTIEDERNGKLIAAAPEMLSAIELVLTQRQALTTKDFDQIAEVYKKATS